MKIPLEEEPFKPVTLTHDQERHLAWLADAVVEETLAEFDDFVYNNNRVLDKKKWKHVMARDNVALYKRHGKGELSGCTPHVRFDQPTLEPTTKQWKVPKVIGVGTLPGSLDDLLYGIVATTKQASHIRTSYIKDECVDHRVVANIIAPTEEDPLRELIVRWSLIYQLAHKLGVTPRDVVHMESAGKHVLPNGETVGHMVIHSVELPEWKDLDHLKIIRCKISACFVFKDAGNGSIELYMRGFVDGGANMPDMLSVFTTCVCLIAVWRFMQCGQNKKLVWMMNSGFGTRPTSRSSTDLFAQARYDNTKTCPVCLRTISGFRSLGRCDVCNTRTCSRCADKRKLTHVQPGGDLVRVSTRVCKACLTIAARTSAIEVALSEYVTPEGGNFRYSTDTISSESSVSVASPGFNLWPKSKPTILYSRPVDPPIHEKNCFRTMEENDRSAGSNATTATDETRFSEEFGNGSSESSESPHPNGYRTSARSVVLLDDSSDEARHAMEQQMKLWMRMHQLRVTAEETYFMTKQNAQMLRNVPSDDRKHSL